MSQPAYARPITSGMEACVSETAPESTTVQALILPISPHVPATLDSTGMETHAKGIAQPSSMPTDRMPPIFPSAYAKLGFIGMEMPAKETAR